ncbi:MAG: hypothetical protein AB8F74_12885 [Saprospiraceae bacterium]
MKNIENIPEELFDLFAQKSFDQLTAVEKLVVEDHMNSAEYEEYRKLVSDFQDIDNSIKVEPSEKRFTRTSESAIRKLLTYRIPVYQAAAVLLLAGFFTFGYFGTDRLDRAGGQSFDSVGTSTETIRKIKEKVINKPRTKTDDAMNVAMDTIGKSLSEDDYPRELIFNL